MPQSRRRCGCPRCHLHWRRTRVLRRGRPWREHLGSEPARPRGGERGALATPRANSVERREPDLAAIEGLDQVTIGAVNGLAIGGAVVFLSCMDIRLASESAWFSIPEVDLDIPLTWNALPRLMRELGPARTKELVMSCDRFSSEDALRWGFLNHRVPDGEALPRARTLAEKLLKKDRSRWR
ncbi:enoyl-CoA hydratase/isomerase family protein [Candidatus Amarobacter glycogenicus]|uniref:enoyl-CoA hydratase/isomerase family protein n=1 Tax=Candidatus Amarobacter glycogenicus TaxID=3140699 RepID=UPI0031CCA507